MRTHRPAMNVYLVSAAQSQQLHESAHVRREHSRQLIFMPNIKAESIRDERNNSNCVITCFWQTVVAESLKVEAGGAVGDVAARINAVKLACADAGVVFALEHGYIQLILMEYS